MMDKSKLKVLFALHLMLMIYSMSGICSKMASQQDFLSFKFCLFYAIIIFLLGFYAIGWQQIIKRLPLTTAFANKAVTVVWGIIWGAVFFHESITVGKVIGAALVIVGVVIYARADEGEVNEQNGINLFLCASDRSACQRDFTGFTKKSGNETL